jgi:hypothetical protein
MPFSPLDKPPKFDISACNKIATAARWHPKNNQNAQPGHSGTTKRQNLQACKNTPCGAVSWQQKCNYIYYFVALTVVAICSLVNMHEDALIQQGTLFSSAPLPITQIINLPLESSPHCDLPHSDKLHRSFIISCLFSGVEFTAVAVYHPMRLG